MRNQQQSANDQRLKQAFDRLTQATDDMRKRPVRRSSAMQVPAVRPIVWPRLKDLLRGIRQQQNSSQVGDLGQRADKLANEQQDFYNRMRQQFGNGQGVPDPRNPRAGQQPGAPSRADVEKLAADKERMAQELDDLERDAQRTARDLAGTQPGASSKLREALAGLQQDEVKLRMKYSANWLRQGRGGDAW